MQSKQKQRISERPQRMQNVKRVLSNITKYATMNVRRQQKQSQLGSHPSMNISCLDLSINMQYVLGTNQSDTVSANIYVYGKDQLVYYLDNIFIKYNLTTKNYRIFYIQNAALPIDSQNSKQQNQPSNVSMIDRVKQQQHNTIQKCQLNISNKIITSKYFACGPNSLLAVLKRINGYYYLCLFWSETDTPAIQFRVSSSAKQIYTNFTFHSTKGYIYLLYKHTASDGDLDKNHGKYQYVKVIQVTLPNQQPLLSYQNKNKIHRPKTSLPTHNKQRVLLNCCIKKTGGGVHDIEDLIIAQDFSQLYLYGFDYFRQWKLSFNEKSMKQSNYRNIERNIKKQKIMNMFWVKQHLFANKYQVGNKNAKPQIESAKSTKVNQIQKKSNLQYLIVVTQLQVLFILNNQLIYKTKMPTQSPIVLGQKQTAQLILQKSLNQIYKTKFRVQNQVVTEQQQQNQIVQHGNNNESVKLTSASNAWIELTKQASNQGQVAIQKQIKVVKFCAALDTDKVFVYKILPNFTIKVENCIGTQSPYQQIRKLDSQQPFWNGKIKNISAANDGSLLLFTNLKLQNYISTRSHDLEMNEINSLYNMGHGHTQSILSISSPQVNNHIATVSKDGSLKIWNSQSKDRSLAIDMKFKLKPIQALMHPSGFMMIINFGHQIKTYAIVSNQLQQIVSTKTNDYCTHIQFCKAHNFILANEKSIVKIYDPMTLYVFGKTQPEDMRLEFKNVGISDNGEYIVYQFCNQKIYRKTVNSMLSPQVKGRLQDYYNKKQETSKMYDSIYCHKQSQIYTCFYFDFGIAVKQTSLNSNQQNSMPLSATNIFIGFTKTKFMTIYSNYGQNLIAQFAVENGAYVTDYCVTPHMIFLATSKGSIIAYPWPILQSSFQIQTIQNSNNATKFAHYKLPKPTHEFVAWRNYSPITVLYKIPNQHQLVIGGMEGLLGFVKYSYMKNGNQVPDNQTIMALSNERKRMIEFMNNIRFMKLADIDKITKLIEKTQCDIQKIDFQIHCEKEKKNNLLAQQVKKLQNNVQKRKYVYCQQRNDKFLQQQKQLKQQQLQYANKKRQLQTIKNTLQIDYKSKAEYQRSQIQKIKTNIEEQKKKYKQKMLGLIDEHKQNIKKLKQKNLAYVKNLQKSFEKLVKQNFKQEEQISEIKQVNVEQQVLIHNQVIKVEQLQADIKAKQLQLTKISVKAEKAKKEDEQAQRLFQKDLQKYNECRYENLILHSQLLKMQNQLYERKQILSKKDEIIKLFYQQKQINETYKQFVSGTISNLQIQKQNAYKNYIKKQQNLRMLFEELTGQINKSQSKKLKREELKHAIKICENEKQQKQNSIKLTIQKLNSLKNYLLVQGVSFDTEQKKIYQQQEKLLSTIRWLQKRFRMNCSNQKKNILLKQSGVNQIINQNKNLLQQCNQLRQQGIIFENQIEHLSQKLAEANKIIQFEKKLKNQKFSLNKQSEQLNEIRKMFKSELDRANQDMQQQI